MAQKETGEKLKLQAEWKEEGKKKRQLPSCWGRGACMRASRQPLCWPALKHLCVQWTSTPVRTISLRCSHNSGSTWRRSLVPEVRGVLLSWRAPAEHGGLQPQPWTAAVLAKWGKKAFERVILSGTNQAAPFLESGSSKTNSLPLGVQIIRWAISPGPVQQVDKAYNQGKDFKGIPLADA